MIEFNVPVQTGKEIENFNELIRIGHFCGDGFFTKKVTQWFDESLNSKTLLTTSCTHALEMIALLINIQPGDEIIVPSYTFVTSASAFTIRGARIVFVDIRADTMNIDESKIKAAITSKTKAIVVVHYAGISCEMDYIVNLAKSANIYVIEDAAQAMMSTYKGRPLGTIGDFGTYSFHETKNYHCGEGGLLIINNKYFIHKAEIIREKGTNRAQFLRGGADKYTWIDQGSSFLPSELNAMFLYSQLQVAKKINKKRLLLWQAYYDNLSKINEIDLPVVTRASKHNAHMFYIKLSDRVERDKIIRHLKSKGVSSVFHYIPLHSSPYGKKIGNFSGLDLNTTRESERILRLPIFYQLQVGEVQYICDSIKGFFE
jgi:dTDP-4-amino-4,6-dideoxygalactose transaminase